MEAVRERERDRLVERNLPTVGSLPKDLHQLGLSQAEGRNLALSYVGGRVGAITFCLHGSYEWEAGLEVDYLGNERGTCMWSVRVLSGDVTVRPSACPEVSLECVACTVSHFYEKQACFPDCQFLL